MLYGLDAHFATVDQTMNNARSQFQVQRGGGLLAYCSVLGRLGCASDRYPGKAYLLELSSEGSDPLATAPGKRTEAQHIELRWKQHLSASI